MKNRTFVRGAAALLLISLGAVAAHAGPPIVNTSFETDAGDWRTMSAANPPTDTAKVSVTHDAANVKQGKGSLKSRLQP